MEFLSELGLVRHDNQEAGCFSKRDKWGLPRVRGELFVCLLGYLFGREAQRDC